MAKRRVVPVLLISGFLGAGKTTLLARWLRSPLLAGATAIVNEFGQVGIDDRLIESSSEMVMLENGCACCTAGEDLAATLERLFWRQLHREIAPIPWIVIETTGVAEPAPILEMLVTRPLLAERYRAAGVVTVFDALNGATMIDAHDECRHQLEQASVVVLSKTDLATADGLASAEALVRRIVPAAPLLHSAGGDVPFDRVLDAIHSADGHPADGRAQSSQHVHEHHHHHHHAATIDSGFAALPMPVARDRLVEALRVMQHRFGAGLLRVKGIVDVDGAVSSVQLGLDGAVEIIALASHGKGAAPRGFTIISRDLPAAGIIDFLLEGLGRGA